MPLWTFSPTPIAYRNAVGSAGTVAGLPVRFESDMGNDYFTGLRNETEAIRTVQAGGIYETRPGDVVRELVTVYTQNGEVTLAVIKQDKGLESQQVAAPVAVEEPPEAVPTGPIRLSTQDYLALSLEERLSGKYTAVSGGSDAAEVEANNAAANANAPQIESAPPSGYYDPNYYAPQEDTYTDPYVGSQEAPQSTGTPGDAPGYSGPVNNESRGPDIDSSGNEGYWL